MVGFARLELSLPLATFRSFYSEAIRSIPLGVLSIMGTLTWTVSLICHNGFIGINGITLGIDGRPSGGGWS